MGSVSHKEPEIGQKFLHQRWGKKKGGFTGIPGPKAGPSTEIGRLRSLPGGKSPNREGGGGGGGGLVSRKTYSTGGLGSIYNRVSPLVPKVGVNRFYMSQGKVFGRKGKSEG